MQKEKSLMDKLMEMFFKSPKVIKSVNLYRFTFNIYENNAVGFMLDNKYVHKFHSMMKLKDGRVIDTRTAKYEKVKSDSDTLEIEYSYNDLILLQHFSVKENASYFKINISVYDKNNKELETNYIRTLDFDYPDKECNPLFLSLDQKMILVPYDNDMWVRYESVPLRPGRTSYEVTSIYNEDTLEGLVLGALDFVDYKNGIKCSDHDARCYYTLSGIADDVTHDIVPHGFVESKTDSEGINTLVSPDFYVGFFDDIRDGLENYASVVREGKYVRNWKKEAVFGWNSYSCGAMTLDQYEEAGDFIYNELKNFKGKDGSTYINLDANFMLNKHRLKKIVDKFHERGQKAGNYLAPCLGARELAFIYPIEGTKGAKYDDILMKLPDGSLYPKIDSGIPIDVTNPIFIKNLEIKIKDIIEMGFDYIKIDFLSHAGVEGERFDKSIKTGRQAIHFLYKTLKDIMDKYDPDGNVFIDFSISPLFPFGYANGRRASCDAFGHIEDTRYVLNALNYGWWQSGTLYNFNDPDHTVLYKSKVDGRSTTNYYEAKSRYNASLISGTVMLLSENFGPIGVKEETDSARERVPSIANNQALNEIATFKKPFRPAYIKSDTTNIYYLNHDGRNFIAVFNFKKVKESYIINADYLKLREKGRLTDLSTGKSYNYKDNIIEVSLDGEDSAIYEVK